MYKNIIYFLDDQQYIFDNVVASVRGAYIYEYRLASFIIFVFCLLAAVLIYRSAKHYPATIVRHGRETQSGGKTEIGILITGIVFLICLFIYQKYVALEYMDFAYLGEGHFSSFREFLLKRQYFSNAHMPGYQLVVWAIKSIFSDVRPVFVALNCLLVGISIVPFYRLCLRNMPPVISLAATAAYLVSPITVFSVYRISPYTSVAAVFILLIYFFITFVENQEKWRMGVVCLLVALLLLLHLFSVIGVAIVLLCVPLYQRPLGIMKGEAWKLYAALGIVTFGSLLFNASAAVIFHNVMIEISSPQSMRLNVYFDPPGGTYSFLSQIVRIVFNLLLSFISESPATAAVSAALLAAGGTFLTLKGRYGVPLFLLSLASCVVLIVSDVPHYEDFGGYPMSYRHLNIFAPFFVYMVFAGVDRGARVIIGFFGKRAGYLPTVACLALLCVYAVSLPGTLMAIRSPDVTSALKYIYDNIEEYDGVVAGNIYFMNEYNSYFHRYNKWGYDASPMYDDVLVSPLDKYINSCGWGSVTRSSGRGVDNVMLDVAPTNVSDFSTLFQNNFLKRIWYVDNNTLRFGVFPDFSGKYEKELKDSLKSALPLSEKDFQGVKVRLYEINHPPLMWDSNHELEIIAGENDFYYIRGVTPDTQLFSEERFFGARTEMMVALPPGTNMVKVQLTIGEYSQDSRLKIKNLDTGAQFAPDISREALMVYEIPVSVNQDKLRLGFGDFAGQYYSKIALKAEAGRTD